MVFDSLPFLEIFLGFIGFGLSIIFCTTFCRACSRYREQQIEEEALRHSESEAHQRSIYFIPFRAEGMSHSDSEDSHAPPRYSTDVYNGPPPSYNELDFKPDDLPPAYTEQDFSVNFTAPNSVIIDAQPPQ
ncbi:uncharacterized protein si:dkey-283b1.6 [Acanthochromis polyacanthus]|uniref:uncharacterized protein si:dkey-283b1.6 n=1 Tax=Acanthochromis polyacanthus TaxID=80966 RepID=UPI0022342B33|nr:uncharacterized protein si:dkey-283b1.6 [Acanthochromis polyacanthus]XP_051806991.1 uncharacterized protein si:dkey-283b1.6 [Acanthochromis polyacanthus]